MIHIKIRSWKKLFNEILNLGYHKNSIVYLWWPCAALLASIEQQNNNLWAEEVNKFYLAGTTFQILIPILVYWLISIDRFLVYRPYRPIKTHVVMSQYVRIVLTSFKRVITEPEVPRARQQRE